MTQTATNQTAWWNCSSGIAGDMMLAALVDAGASQLAVMDAWAALGVDGFAATFERVDRAGVSAVWTNISFEQHHREIAHDRDHDHHHHEHHDHRRAADVIEMIRTADLPSAVGARAVAVYRHLAAVEGAIHQRDPDDVELHEVGALDSILDIVGICAALEDLHIDTFTYSPVAVGHGVVQTEHGTMLNPVPAVMRMLADAGARTIGVDTTRELSTPTGVAVLTALGSCAPMPLLQITSAGTGAGTANPPGHANVAQVVVGTATDGAASNPAEQPSRHPAGSPTIAESQAVVVEVNVDDTTGEVIAHTIARLLDAGAFDAWATPIVMKKGRPAFTVSALCPSAERDQMRSILCTETGSLGARSYIVDRWPQPRRLETVTVGGQPIAVKVSGHRVKVEYDDAAAAAARLDRPLREVIGEAERLGVDLFCNSSSRR